MFAEFLNIVFRSIKLDKNLYKNNKNFGEASIYFAGLIMILDGVAGAVAANTILPVIGVPLSGSAVSGFDSLLATVQMPKGIPVATVAIDGAMNAGLLAIQILSLNEPKYVKLLESHREEMASR